MKLVFCLVALLFETSFANCSAPAYVDRPCGSDIKNLWLDVVVLMDNSQGMTSGGLRTIQSDVLSLFSEGTRIGTDPQEPRTTRIGLISYSNTAQVMADLNKLQSIDDLKSTIFNGTISETYESNLAKGLEAAEDMLYYGSVDTKRDYYQRAIIVYASVFNSQFDPAGVANRLKADGINIITIAFDEENQVSGELDWELSKVASPRYNFSNFEDENILDQIRGALLESNCFCPNEWLQYRNSFIDEYSKPFGTCLHYLSLTASWTAARFACRHIHNNSHLATEFDKAKHDYIFQMVQNSEQPEVYHIGLNMVKGVWKWDQPPGLEQPNLQGWEGWDKGYPLTSSTKNAVMNKIGAAGTVWQNVQAMSVGGYVCEVAACDTDNFCDRDDVN